VCSEHNCQGTDAESQLHRSDRSGKDARTTGWGTKIPSSDEKGPKYDKESFHHDVN
jgi:hypothetical protein